MSVLKCLFNPVSQDAAISEFSQVVFEVDKNGKKVCSFKRIDPQKTIESNGFVELWDLTSLIKAGINPESLSVMTSSNSRLDGQMAIENEAAAANVEFDKVESNKE